KCCLRQKETEFIEGETRLIRRRIELNDATFQSYPLRIDRLIQSDGPVQAFPTCFLLLWRLTSLKISGWLDLSASCRKRDAIYNPEETTGSSTSTSRMQLDEVAIG